MTAQCPQCRKIYVPKLLKQEDWEEQTKRWKGGESIQNVWPKATVNEREQLMTGHCSQECWDITFKDPEGW